jgi:dCTP deaminase
MILSNVSIHEAFDNQWLKIAPEPAPRATTQGGPKCPFQTSAVDLRLGSEIAFFREGIPAQIDLRKGDFNTMFGPLSETRTLTDDQPFVLRPNKLVLGKTFEHIEFPLLPDGTVSLAARVEGKSSYARCGLLVHFTAPTIHAGFAGTITLELINLGPLDIALYPQMPICQLIIEQVHGVPFRNDSQFQNQTQPGGGQG